MLHKHLVNKLADDTLSWLLYGRWRKAALLRVMNSGKDSVVERGVATGVPDVRVGKVLQQGSRALLLSAFYGLSALGQETECEY